MLIVTMDDFTFDTTLDCPSNIWPPKSDTFTHIEKRLIDFYPTNVYEHYMTYQIKKYVTKQISCKKQ